MATTKSKVLVVGGTGYMGRRIVKASLAAGHPTYVLQRLAPEIGLDVEKLQMLFSFKKQGAHLVEGSFSDFQSLVDAVKLVDVVICTMSGTHIRSHNIMLQLKLVEALKEARNVKATLHYGLRPFSPAWAIRLLRHRRIAIVAEKGQVLEFAWTRRAGSIANGKYYHQ